MVPRDVKAEPTTNGNGFWQMGPHRILSGIYNRGVQGGTKRFVLGLREFLLQRVYILLLSSAIPVRRDRPSGLAEITNTTMDFALAGHVELTEYQFFQEICFELSENCLELDKSLK